MGRAIGLVFFVLLFVIFLVVKAAIQGGKAAYSAVFNPNGRDEMVLRVMGMIHVTVQQYMRLNYTGKRGDLRLAFLNCTNEAQKIIEANGFSAPISVTEAIVRHAIIEGGFSTADELNRLGFVS